MFELDNCPDAELTSNTTERAKFLKATGSPRLQAKDNHAGVHVEQRPGRWKRALQWLRDNLSALLVAVAGAVIAAALVKHFGL